MTSYIIIFNFFIPDIVLHSRHPHSTVWMVPWCLVNPKFSLVASSAHDNTQLEPSLGYSQLCRSFAILPNSPKATGGTLFTVTDPGKSHRLTTTLFKWNDTPIRLVFQGVNVLRSLSKLLKVLAGERERAEIVRTLTLKLSLWYRAAARLLQLRLVSCYWTWYFSDSNALLTKFLDVPSSTSAFLGSRFEDV